jgi:hypothetical protein
LELVELVQIQTLAKREKLTRALLVAISLLAPNPLEGARSWLSVNLVAIVGSSHHLYPNPIPLHRRQTPAQEAGRLPQLSGDLVEKGSLQLRSRNRQA